MFQQRSQRIWLIDRQAEAIGADLRDDLGQWIKRRLTKSVTVKAQEATTALHNCGVPIPELAQLWKEQQEAQLSLRARESVRSSLLSFSLSYKMHLLVSRKSSTVFYCSKVK